MNSEQIIKKQTKSILKNQGWAKAICSFILLSIYFVLIIVIADFLMMFAPKNIFELSLTDMFNFTNLSSILNLVYPCVILIFCVFIGFMLSPAINGFVLLCYNLAKNNESDFADNFYYFSNTKLYIKALSFNLHFLSKIILPYIGVSIVIIALQYCIANIFNTFEFISFFTPIIFLLLIEFVILAVLAIKFRYFLAALVFCEYPEMPVSACFSINKQLIKKHEIKKINNLFKSYIPLILLCVLVVPALFVIPYMTVAFCVSGKWIFKKNSDIINISNINKFTAEDFSIT